MEPVPLQVGFDMRQTDEITPVFRGLEFAPEASPIHGGWKEQLARAGVVQAIGF